MMTPIELIIEERNKQMSKKGWTLEHDDEHTDQCLAMAAALYASPTDDLVRAVRTDDEMTYFCDVWPWPDHDNRDQHDRMRRLQIAGALIVAEMERLQRLEVSNRSRWIMCGLCDTAYDPADTKEAAIHDHPEPQSGEPRDQWIASKMKYSDWIIKTEDGKSWADRVKGKSKLKEYKKRFIKYITDLGIELHMAQSELDGHLSNYTGDFDMSDPEDDARECLTYWEE